MVPLTSRNHASRVCSDNLDRSSGPPPVNTITVRYSSSGLPTNSSYILMLNSNRSGTGSSSPTRFTHQVAMIALKNALLDWALMGSNFPMMCLKAKSPFPCVACCSV